MQPDPTRPDLGWIMDGVRAGDTAAISQLFEVASGPVRSMVRSIVRSGSIDIDGDRLEDIVRDYIVELIRLAPGWKADGGAAPWTWAEKQLRPMVFASIGPFADPLEEHLEAEALSAPRPNDEQQLDDVLEIIGRSHPLAAALSAALRSVKPRDRRVWLEYMVERAHGNRAASEAVAARHEITPANVRKICSRVRERLRQAVAEREDLAALAAIPALAA